MGCRTFMHKTAPSLWRSPPHPIHPSSTDPTHNPKGTQIQSAVFPQFTHQTNRQTDRWDMRQVYYNTCLRCIDFIAMQLIQTQYLLLNNLWKHFIHATYVSYGPVSVCLSVCVCLSHDGIVSKWLHRLSWFLHTGLPRLMPHCVLGKSFPKHWT